jgi:hypothetical protein
MADAKWAVFSGWNAALSTLSWGRRVLTMVEILLIAQLVRNPLQAMARRWYCRSLFRATRGRRRCAECTGASV